tara:strand:- start:32 stop:172 length:141 start_codon:yes stop_codon:yes gene_type:complete
MVEKKRHYTWKEKTTKEKLDMIFVMVAITAFSLTILVHLKNLNGNK